MGFNVVNRITMILEHVFNFFDRFPYDNTSLLVNLDRHLIILETECSCGFKLYFTPFTGLNFGHFTGCETSVIIYAFLMLN